MKLTSASEQAIAVIALLATQKKEQLLSSDAIYQKLNLSKSYVQKLLRKLVVAQIISGVTGNSGGFTLAKPLTAISMYDVFKAIEGEFHSFSNTDVLANAFNGFDEQVEEGHMVITRHFKRADKLWCDYLSSMSVADVMLDVFSDEKAIPYHDWNLD